MANCKQCNQSFEITDDDRKFYQKIDVPEPSMCPDCRMQRRMAFRGEKYLYYDKCDLCGKKMISTYSSDDSHAASRGKPQKIYCSDCWWSDRWDPVSYGKDFDFNVPFFKQMRELIINVPKFNLYSISSENCDYTNYTAYNKNCYLLFGSWKNENCLYCDTALSCRNLVDSLFCNNSELGYEQIDSNNNYKSFFIQNSENNYNNWFLFDCQNCESCIACANLRNKKYYIFNKPSNKQEFELLKQSFSSKKVLDDFKHKFADFVKNQAIHKHIVGTKNENVSGNFIFNSKNIFHSYSIWDSEEIKYSFKTTYQKNSMDCFGTGDGELAYESIANTCAYNSKFIATGLRLQNSDYSMHCYINNHIFGCTALRHKKYYILNKQYSKKDYEKLRTKIIKHMQLTGEWGEFFPIQVSPYCYNETLAQEYFPLTKKEALKSEYKWKDPEPKQYQSQIYKIPDDIKNVQDDICEVILNCHDCAKNYKIVTQELAFYRQMGLPIPLKCFFCRHKDRFTLRNPYKLWKRKCDKCGIEIQTTYSPDRSEIVYCEACYLKEVY